MAANEREIYRQKALDVQVGAYHAAALELLDRNPDGWLHADVALGMLMDKLWGYDGDRAADDAWGALRVVACTKSGIQHGELHSCVKERVLGRLGYDMVRFTKRAVADAEAPSDERDIGRDREVAAAIDQRMEALAGPRPNLAGPNPFAGFPR